VQVEQWLVSRPAMLTKERRGIILGAAGKGRGATYQTGTKSGLELLDHVDAVDVLITAKV